jgi:hypothetical protein
MSGSPRDSATTAPAAGWWECVEVERTAAAPPAPRLLGQRQSLSHALTVPSCTEAADMATSPIPAVKFMLPPLKTSPSAARAS